MDLYEDLINEVKSEFETKIENLIVGVRWILVKSKRVGIAITYNNNNHDMGIEEAGELVGKSASELLQFLKTFDTLKVGIGIATLNSLLPLPENYESINIFDYLIEIGKGKRIVFIGHFEDIKKLNGIAKEIICIERNPKEGDYLDTFQEYLIPKGDIVAITGSTFVNKSIKRILELSKGKYTIVFGPSTPLSKTLFDYGVDMIGGIIPKDEIRLINTISQGGSIKKFKNYVDFVTIKRRSLWKK